MLAILGLLYLVLMLGVLLVSAFIVFHILRYSFNKTSKAVMLCVFLFGTIGIVIINMILLSSINFGNLSKLFQ